MEKTDIEWADYTWNPVIGCNHGCKYCYARKWAKRSGQSFEPHRSKQWEKPFKIKEPSKIFVCSLADLFGEWIPEDWINDVIEITQQCPQHEFMFLTKNPCRYFDFKFPENCWLGTTITGPKDLWRLFRTPDNRTFVSIEPLLYHFKNPRIPDNGETTFKDFDLVIVGAMTRPATVKPEKEWIDSIKHPNIFYKENIKKYME